MIEALQDISYDDRPAVLVIADDPRAGEIGALLEQVGARPARFVKPHDAASEKLSTVMYDATYCALDMHIDPELSFELLTRLDSARDISGVASVVEIRRADIDRAMAVAAHEDVTLLCEPAAGDRIAAFALALRPRKTRLQDVSKDIGSARLARLSEEVSRIAHALASMAEAESLEVPSSAQRLTGGHAARPESIFLGDEVVLGVRIREMIRARRARDMFFSDELFADPVWDMLLDLMAARCERQKVSVPSLCIAAAVPATTALRWLKMMTSSGIVVRKSDVTDGRRVFIDLSDESASAMHAYFNQFAVMPAV